MSPVLCASDSQSAVTGALCGPCSTAAPGLPETDHSDGLAVSAPEVGEENYSIMPGVLRLERRLPLNSHCSSNILRSHATLVKCNIFSLEHIFLSNCGYYLVSLGRKKKMMPGIF